MIRPIEISWAANGWIVKVGCQTFVFESAAELTAQLLAYLTRPEETEKWFLETAKNIRYTNGLVPTPVGATNQATETYRDVPPHGEYAGPATARPIQTIR